MFATVAGAVAIFATHFRRYTSCYGNCNHPQIVEDLVAIFEHNGIPLAMADKEVCCGMPKLELGDLEAVARAKEINIPILAAMVDDGWDIVTPIPSCTSLKPKNGESC